MSIAEPVVRPQEMAAEELPATLPPPKAGRLVSLDAYRGLTMLFMVFGALHLHDLAKDAHKHPFLNRFDYHLEHVEWTGGGAWDMIQPSFMFMVGVAVPFSLASRRSKGQSFNRMLIHALWRSLLLVALAVFIASNWSKQTNFVFTNVLGQIGLGYPFLFLIAWTRPRWQAVAAAVILIGYWAAFALYPAPATPLPLPGLGAATATPAADLHVHLSGFAAHWDKNTNFASAFDRWFLNLFPRPARFDSNEGGYQTLNFVPSLATMIFGLLAGELLRTRKPAYQKLVYLLLGAAAGISAGYALDFFHLCPIVKRIWTPSWTLYAGGWTCLTLAVFYVIVDVAGLRVWTFPLVVVGMNSIAIYVLYQLFHSAVKESLKIHLGWVPVFSEKHPYFHQWEGGVFVVVLWLICFWMYRKKIFVRI